MKYHDNKITFKIDAMNVFTVGLCEFTIAGLCITNGQDPDRKNSVGDSQVWSGPKEGSFNFEVGRSNNSEPANFWKKNFSVNQSTFEHYPDKLNFAFYGPLDIQVTKVGEPAAYYTIKKFGMGQGHAGGSNNWWVASSETTQKSGFKITCKGESTAGDVLYFTFHRGNNAVDVVDLQSIDLS